MKLGLVLAALWCLSATAVSAAPVVVVPGSTAAYFHLPKSIGPDAGGGSGHESPSQPIIPVATPGEACDVAAGDTVAINEGATLVLTCQSGVWAPTSGGSAPSAGSMTCVAFKTEQYAGASPVQRYAPGFISPDKAKAVVDNTACKLCSPGQKMPLIRLGYVSFYEDFKLGNGSDSVRSIKVVELDTCESAGVL